MGAGGPAWGRGLRALPAPRARPRARLCPPGPDQGAPQLPEGRGRGHDGGGQCPGQGLPGLQGEVRGGPAVCRVSPGRGGAASDFAWGGRAEDLAVRSPRQVAAAPPTPLAASQGRCPPSSFTARRGAPKQGPGGRRPRGPPAAPAAPVPGGPGGRRTCVPSRRARCPPPRGVRHLGGASRSGPGVGVARSGRCC